MDKDMAVVDVKEKKQSETVGMSTPKPEEVPTVEETPKTLVQYVEELKVYLESIPGPHEGRIQELKDLIRKGKLVTKEAIRETAEKLAQRFLDRSDL